MPHYFLLHWHRYVTPATFTFCCILLDRTEGSWDEVALAHPTHFRMTDAYWIKTAKRGPRMKERAIRELRTVSHNILQVEGFGDNATYSLDLDAIEQHIRNHPLPDGAPHPKRATQETSKTATSLGNPGIPEGCVHHSYDPGGGLFFAAHLSQVRSTLEDADATHLSQLNRLCRSAATNMSQEETSTLISKETLSNKEEPACKPLSSSETELQHLSWQSSDVNSSRQGQLNPDEQQVAQVLKDLGVKIMSVEDPGKILNLAVKQGADAEAVCTWLRDVIAEKPLTERPKSTGFFLKRCLPDGDLLSWLKRRAVPRPMTRTEEQRREMIKSMEIRAKRMEAYKTVENGTRNSVEWYAKRAEKAENALRSLDAKHNTPPA